MSDSVRRLLSALLVATGLAGVVSQALAEGNLGSLEPQPVVDTLLHYDQSQSQVISHEDAIAALRTNGVERAAVVGIPPEPALKLYGLAPDLILPIYGPDGEPGSGDGWQSDRDLVAEVRKAIQQGPYRGIGVLRMNGEFALHWLKQAVLRGLLAVGGAYDVPVLLDMEISKAEPLLSLCRGNPGNRLVLVRAGATLPPEELGRVLGNCSNVWMELSARAAGHQAHDAIIDADGRLLPAWEALVKAHPDRFVVASDTLGAEAGKGVDWEQIGRRLDFHRRWASFLPEKVAAAVLRENAITLFTQRFSKPAADTQEKFGRAQ